MTLNGVQFGRQSMSNKAHITISRTSSNMDDDHMSIQIIDRASGVIIFRGTMELEDFVRALTGQAHVDINTQCMPTVAMAKKYSKRKEMKTVFLKFKSYGGDKKELYQLIENYLIDGWTLWDDCLRSQQNTSRGHKVILCRYVDQK